MIKKKDNRMVQDIGITLRQHWRERLPKQEHEKLMTTIGNMRMEYSKDSNGSLCYLQAVQGHSGGIPISPELMNYTLTPYNWKAHLHPRKFVDFSIHFGKW